MAIVITGYILQDVIQVAGKGLSVKITEDFAGICNMTRVTAEETGVDDAIIPGSYRGSIAVRTSSTGLVKLLLQRMSEQGVGRACIAGRIPVQHAKRLLQYAGFFGLGAGNIFKHAGRQGGFQQ